MKLPMHRLEVRPVHVRIDLRRRDARVPQSSCDPQVRAPDQQVRREAVP